MWSGGLPGGLWILEAAFSLGSESKYGVAVRCSSLVIQATHGELANPKIECSSAAPSTVFFTVNGIGSSLLAAGDQVCIDASCQPAAASVGTTANLEAGAQEITLKNSSGSGKTAPSGGSGSLVAGDYIRVAQVNTNSYTVGGGQITLP